MYRGGFGGRRTGRRGGRDQNYYLATMLVTQVVRRLNELERKPPFTILLLGLCAAAHYTEVRDWLPSVGQACLRPERLHPGESMLGIFNPVRMIFSSLLHANEYHLYHNCISLLNKGVQLELRHKPLPFAAMTCFLLGASSGLYVLISHLGVAMLGLTPSCAIGFSAVLFGYKVVAALESGHTGEQTIFGIRVPKGVYLSWVELVTIQFVHPNASFLGHLCGVLAGWLYYLLFLKQRGRSRFHGHGTTGRRRQD